MDKTSQKVLLEILCKIELLQSQKITCFKSIAILTKVIQMDYLLFLETMLQEVP
jgi:hypothetical protein